MTIHASKGLEFPIAIISGLTTQQQVRRGGVHVTWPPDGSVGYSLGRGNSTPDYDDFVPVDEQMDSHERLRLLYVACTRACDHLVVSMHRGAEGATSTLAAILASVDAHVGPPQVHRRGKAHPADGTTGRSVLPAAVLDRATWSNARRAALINAHRSRTVAATTLAEFAASTSSDPGLKKQGRDLDLPPWQKGRYGTAVGRAVHGVLQTVPLATGAGLSEASASQAAAEGVLGHEGDIETLARSALSSSLVVEAAASRHWREVFVATPVADRLIEGYIDLAFERPDGLVVVDYKTDAWRDEEDLDEKVRRYRMQAGAYAFALAEASGQPVVEATLLFLAPEQAVTRTIVDLPALFEEVQAMVPEVIAGGEAASIE